MSPDSNEPVDQPAQDEQVPETVTTHRLQFVGSGGEYFRIWIVNLVLSILSLGIYSAWAKVRREQYFHRNTLLDGSGFDYHGDPVSILKGRIIAVGLLIVSSLLPLLIPWVLVPWLITRSLVFRTRNTSFRGLRFDFHGPFTGFLNIFLGYLLAFATLSGVAIVVYAIIKPVVGMLLPLVGGLLMIPAFMHSFKLFQFNNLAFGTSVFQTQCKIQSFYLVYLKVFLLLALLILLDVLLFNVCVLIFGFVMGKVFFVIEYLSVILVAQVYLQALTNLLWNNTHLGQHGFVSDQRFWGVVRINISNWLLILLTLGFYWPWAKVKMFAYRARHMAVLATGSLDDFIAGATQEKSAVGEEVAEAFDLGVSL